MFNQMCMLLEKPQLYKKTEAAFWNDRYISEQMLKAHLDPGFDGANRGDTCSNTDGFFVR